MTRKHSLSIHHGERRVQHSVLRLIRCVSRLSRGQQSFPCSDNARHWTVLLVFQQLNRPTLFCGTCNRIRTRKPLKVCMQYVGNVAKLPNPNSWEPSNRMLPNPRSLRCQLRGWRTMLPERKRPLNEVEQDIYASDVFVTRILAVVPYDRVSGLELAFK